MVLLVERQKRAIQDGEVILTNWRTAFAGDPVYQWGMDSRDAVVHERDLDLSSVAVIEFVGPGQTFTLNPSNFGPSASNEELMSAMLMSKPRSVREGTLTVSRRWVSANLPNEELLGVGARLFEALRGLVVSFHIGEACSLDLPKRDCATDSLSSATCMQLTSATTSISIDVASRMQIVTEAYNLRLDEEWDPESARSRYGLLIDVGGDPVNTAMAHLKRASLFLTIDSEALPFATLYKDRQPLAKLLLGGADNTVTISVFQFLAERARATGADGFVFTSEIWTNHRTEPQKVHEHDQTFYDVRPDRDEALVVIAGTSDGRQVKFTRAFTRDSEGWPSVSEHIERSFTLDRNAMLVLQAIRTPGLQYDSPRGDRGR